MVCPWKIPAALVVLAGSSAAVPTPSASDANLPAPPEQMAEGSASSEARRGRISSCAAIPCASLRNGDTFAPWRAVRTHEDQRRWQYWEMVRRIGHGALHAARRVCFSEIRVEPPPPPTPRRAPRECRAGAKRRHRAAPLSDPVLPVASKPSVPQRAPVIPEPQHAAGVSAGKLRALQRRVRALGKATSSSDHDVRLRALEQATTSSDQDARLRALEKAASSPDQETRLRALQSAAPDPAERLLVLREETVGWVLRLNQRLTELEESTSASDELRASVGEINTELDGLTRDCDNIYKELDVLQRDRLPRDTLRPRCPSPS